MLSLYLKSADMKTKIATSSRAESNIRDKRGLSLVLSAKGDRSMSNGFSRDHMKSCVYIYASSLTRARHLMTSAC